MVSAASSEPTPFRHEQWSSRLVFIWAATGSAVGLGNIWKFPYVAGQSGGGAFVLIYLLCIALIGLPILMAEVMLGRRGQQSPIHTMRYLARREGKSGAWQIAGWTGVLASFIILSFYSVVAGWSLAFIIYAITGSFSGATPESIGELFGGLLASPWKLLMWHTVFIAMTTFVVARGVRAGLERAVSILMPALFILLLVLVGYAALATGRFGEGLAFLFHWDFSKLDTIAVLNAMGQAFFTLSLGAGVLIAYGSYLPKDVSIARTAITVAAADTLVALLAGLAIFPIVFANNLEPGAGPGLIFQTLPLAFGQMTGGLIFGTLFFILLTFAAWTSSISMLEPMTEYLQEHKGMKRVTSTLIGAVGAWLLGLVSLLSFNLWSEIKLFGKTAFDLLDFLTSNIMMPLTGLLVALFAGWIMVQASSRDELQMGAGGYQLWRFVIRFIAPLGVLIIFLYQLIWA